MIPLLPIAFVLGLGAVAYKTLAPTPKLTLAPGETLTFSLLTRGTAANVSTQGLAQVLKARFNLDTQRMTQDPSSKVWRGSAIYRGTKPMAVVSNDVVLFTSEARS